MNTLIVCTNACGIASESGFESPYSIQTPTNDNVCANRRPKRRALLTSYIHSSLMTFNYFVLYGSD